MSHQTGPFSTSIVSVRIIFFLFVIISVFPQGRTAVRSIILAVIAVALSAVGMGSCNFMRVDALGWGFLWREQTEFEDQVTSRKLECTGWRPNEEALFDGMWKAGTAFAYLSLITAVLTAIPVISLSCSTLQGKYTKLCAVSFLLVALFQMLAFLGFGSEICSINKCRVSFGAGITIGAMLFSILTALSLFVVPPLMETVDPPIAGGDGGQGDGDNDTHDDEDGQEGDIVHDVETPADEEDEAGPKEVQDPLEASKRDGKPWHATSKSDKKKEDKIEYLRDEPPSEKKNVKEESDV